MSSVVLNPMTDNELARQIIGAAIELHRQLGPGLLESVYEACLCHELMVRNIPFEKQKPVPVGYKGIKLGCGYRLGILVSDRIVLERKAVDCFSPAHDSVMIVYLNLSGHRLGLLINFNVQVLKEGIKRIIV